MSQVNENVGSEGDGPAIIGVRNRFSLIEDISFDQKHYFAIMDIAKRYSKGLVGKNLSHDELHNLGKLINAAYPFTNKVEGGGNLGLQVESLDSYNRDCQFPTAIFAATCKNIGIETRILFPSYNHDHPYVEILTPGETLYGSFRRGEEDGESSFFEFLDERRKSQIETMIRNDRITVIPISEDGFRQMDTLIN